GDRTRRRQDCQHHSQERGSVRPPPPPLPPALGQAAVPHSSEGTVGQVPPQVSGEGRRVAIALGGGVGQTLLDQVCETDAHLRTGAAQSPYATTSQEGLTCQGFVKQHAERIDIGTLVHRQLDLPTFLKRAQGVPLFGRHVNRRSAEPVWTLFARLN